MGDFPEQEIERKAAEIRDVNPTARLIPARALREWALQLLDGRHSSMLDPPDSLGPPTDDESELEDDMEEGNEFGDVVELHGTKFVICSGLVVPLDLLDSKILPMIQEYFDAKNITMDSIFEQLTQAVEDAGDAEPGGRPREGGGGA